KQDRAAAAPLEKLAVSPRSAVGRAHALWALDGLGALKPELVLRALEDREPGVREQALKLAEPRLAGSAALRSAVVALADDPSPRVRFQLAFTLGYLDTPEAVAALAKIARRPDTDSWTQTAVLSSATKCAGRLLEALA